MKKTRKRTYRGGNFFNFAKKVAVADNDLVTISYNSKPILCDICKSKQFQRRDATFGKSKTANILNDMVLGNDANIFEDISVTCYFCNKCANAIIVRQPKAMTDSYPNIIQATEIKK